MKDKNNGGSSEEDFELPKINVRDTLKIIPPPSMLKAQTKKRTSEKRIRIRYLRDISENNAKISPKLASELGLGEDETIEIVVAGKKKFTFTPIIDESIPVNEVWVNEDLLKINGIADNSIATVKRVHTR